MRKQKDGLGVGGHSLGGDPGSTPYTSATVIWDTEHVIQAQIFTGMELLLRSMVQGLRDLLCLSFKSDLGSKLYLLPMRLSL